jgi:CRP-like cAMP-binding protein
MNGVVKNVTTSRFFESGQMLNHDSIMLKENIQNDYIAETDVSVLKYENATFQQILDAFPDF